MSNGYNEIRLFGGPCHGKLFAITDEQFKAGTVEMEVNLPPKGYLLDEPLITYTVIYKKAGSENAFGETAFEFAGKVKRCPSSTT
jgi:hypothetical protein